MLRIFRDSLTFPFLYYNTKMLLFQVIMKNRLDFILTWSYFNHTFAAGEWYHHGKKVR